MLGAVTEVDEDEKTDAERDGARQDGEEWEGDRTEVDARPPVDSPTDFQKPR
jgi:hypothetical protein